MAAVANALSPPPPRWRAEVTLITEDLDAASLDTVAFLNAVATLAETPPASATSPVVAINMHVVPPDVCVRAGVTRALSEFLRGACAMAVAIYGNDVQVGSFALSAQKTCTLRRVDLSALGRQLVVVCAQVPNATLAVNIEGDMSELTLGNIVFSIDAHAYRVLRQRAVK